MEYDLKITEKIKTLQLAESNTLEMFAELIKFDEVLPEEQITDFAIYYRNRVSRVTLYQTDLICYERRLAIYNCFVNYAIDHDLFRFALNQQKPTTNTFTYEMSANPLSIFPS